MGDAQDVRAEMTQRVDLWKLVPADSRVALCDEIIRTRPVPPRLLAALLEPPHVTGRETQVAHLVAEGLEDMEIADRLGVSYQTVKTHVKSLLRKLAVRNRVELAAVVYGQRAPLSNT